MKRHDYEALLNDALATPHGITLQLADWHEAEHARLRFYRTRDQLRRGGDTSFDDLSFVLRRGGVLQVLRRDQLRCNYDDGLPLKQRPIGRDELPDKFGYCNTTFPVKRRKK